MSTKTTDALEIMRRRYFSEPDPEREAFAAAYRIALDVAQGVYDLRTTTGLSQAEFANRVGVAAADIESLEEADYDGDPVAALSRIATALGKQVRVHVADREPFDVAA